MKLAVLLIVLGTATTAFADDYDICLARRHALEAQLGESPPSAQVALEKELPLCRRDSTPPLSSGRLAVELIPGAAAGVGGGFVGAVIGVAMTKDSCTGEEWCGLGGAIVGGYIGATLVPPFAVYLVGAAGDQTGSLGATFGGALLGGAAGLISGIAVGQKNAPLGLGIAMAGPVIGATVGFNLTRRYRDSGPSLAPGSLVRVDGGHAALGVPLVMRSSKDGFVGLSLASGSF